MTEERIERTFETSESAEVDISNIDGTIEIRGWDRPEVRIVAVKAGADSDVSVEVGGEGSRVWAKTRPAESLQNLFGWLKRTDRPATVDYTAHVPRHADVSASGLSGPIRVAGVHQAVKVRSVNGQIVLEDLSGEVSANTVNSAIEGRRIDGMLTTETVSGHVDLTDVQLSNLRAESVDGSIHVTGQVDNFLGEAINGTVRLTSSLNPAGEYAVKTVNGSFRLAIPTDTDCEFVASGVNVDVTCELPHAFDGKRWGQRSGRVNDGGGASVTFDTINGTLTITGEEARETAPVGPVEAPMPEPMPVAPEPAPEPEPVGVEPVPVEPAVPPASKLDILKAIERGELAVEDALERLRHLN